MLLPDVDGPKLHGEGTGRIEGLSRRRDGGVLVDIDPLLARANLVGCPGVAAALLGNTIQEFILRLRPAMRWAACHEGVLVGQQSLKRSRVGFHNCSVQFPFRGGALLRGIGNAGGDDIARRGLRQRCCAKKPKQQESQHCRTALHSRLRSAIRDLPPRVGERLMHGCLHIGRRPSPTRSVEGWRNADDPPTNAHQAVIGGRPRS